MLAAIPKPQLEKVPRHHLPRAAKVLHHLGRNSSEQTLNLLLRCNLKVGSSSTSLETLSRQRLSRDS
jgi:hypothetical protein